MPGLFELLFLRELTVSYAVAAQIALLHPQTSVAKVEDAAGPAKAGKADFVTRPLFLPSRRPTPKPEPPAVTPEATTKPARPPTPDPGLVLLGVVLTPQGREAIVRVDGGSTRALVEGEGVGPWSLKRVFDDRVIFSTPQGDRPLVFAPHKGTTFEPEIAANPAQQSPLLRRRP
jgi:hypothetical protein